MGQAATKIEGEPQSLKGQKNIYTCQKCFGHIVTVNRDAGTTPFMVSCRATLGCDGKMNSSMYRVFDQSMAAAFEWYKPSVLELGSLKPGALAHVEKGGLLLRAYRKAGAE